MPKGTVGPRGEASVPPLASPRRKGNMKKLEIRIQVDDATYIILEQLCQFYHKSESGVVDMALTQLALQTKFITEKFITERIAARKGGE